MRSISKRLRARPRMLLAAAAGIVAGIAVPGVTSPVTRALLGWNVCVWLYLLLVGTFMLRASHSRLRQVAQSHAEGSATVSAFVITASSSRAVPRSTTTAPASSTRARSIGRFESRI